jgi:hypothetical protein
MMGSLPKERDVDDLEPVVEAIHSKKSAGSEPAQHVRILTQVLMWCADKKNSARAKSARRRNGFLSSDSTARPVQSSPAFVYHRLGFNGGRFSEV